MSYYAHGHGSALIKAGCAKDSVREAVKNCSILNRDYFECELGGVPLELDVSHTHDYYHEEEITEFLNAIIPFVSDGQVEFIGEDGAHWAFIFDPEALKWEEKSGRIVYGEETTIDLSKLTVLSVYHSFDSEAPVYLFASEEEAIAELKKQVDDEIRIETEESGRVLGTDIFVTRADDYSFAQIRTITPDGEEDFTEWNIGQIIDKTKGAGV